MVGFGSVLALPLLAHAVDRIVGVNAPTGGVTLAKKVHVQAGTEVTQVEVLSNDVSTVFPAVRLRRLNGRVVGDVVSEIRNVSAGEGGRHRFVIDVPPVVFLESEDILIEVILPPTNGADGIRSGAGLGANNLNDAQVTSYVGNTSTGELQPVIDADFCVSVLGSGNPGKSGQPPGSEAPSDRSKPLALLVRTQVGGKIEVHVSAATLVSASVEVYDVKGALVRKLSRGNLDPGEHVLSWDRRDEHGLRVAAGVYIIAARVGEVGTVRKAVVLH